MLKQPHLADVLSHAASHDPEDINTTDDYEALTPSIIEPGESVVYTDALNFACSRRDIRNIAVTGAYGAGKSSVLRTWKECPDNDLRIMTVSLADFEMQSTPRPKAEPADRDGTTAPADDKKAAAEEKTIEYSILQQLLYKEKKSALPYSRIERISDITSFQVAAVAVNLLIILSVMLVGLLCLFPDYVRKKLSLPESVSHHLIEMPAVRLVLAGLLLFAALFLCVKKLHRIGLFDRRVSVDKIDMLKGAISTRPASPSLLNIYIDEIVYFFEQTGYNVVIFEDLDRHNDGTIFIKLREINQIINNTRPDGEPVRFIYAVRDGLFSTAEARTKFFDFVIPVIPVMDSENAAEHFSSMFREDELNGPGFSKCVSQLSLFIPDMRIMRNIANEFRVYQNMVNGSDNIVRLLSMIAYKNICAEDYHSIDEKKGVLYSFVRSFTSGELKSDYISQKIQCSEKIESEINIIRDNDSDTLEAVRTGILSDCISPALKEILHFNASGLGVLSLDSLAKDEELFTKLMSLDSFQIRFVSRNLDIKAININDINGMKDTYERRKELLHMRSEGIISEKQEEIRLIKSHIQSLRNISLQALAETLESTGFAEWAEKKLHKAGAASESFKNSAEQLEFIYFLLISGYVASDYMFYRSVFRAGSLSREDNEYIKAVSISRHSAMTLAMPLSRVENVIAKLVSLGLMMERRAWHPDVLLFLLEHDDPKLRPIMQLQAEDDEDLLQLASQTFVNWTLPQRILYVEQMSYINDKARGFIKRLSVMNNRKVACELLILHMCSSNLGWDNQTTDMRQWARAILADNGAFPDLIPEDYGQIFMNNILETGVYVYALEACISGPGKEIIRLIVKSKRWDFSGVNLRSIYLTLCEQKKLSGDNINKEPLFSVEMLGVPELTEAVYDNINSFITDFFIPSQEYQRVPELLNNNSVTAESVSGIITKMQFTLDDVSKVNNRNLNELGNEDEFGGDDVYSLMMKHERIKPNWSNVIKLLNQDEKNISLLTTWFDRNYSEITETVISGITQEVFSLLIQHLFNSDSVSERARIKMLSCIPLILPSLPENLALERAALLIEYRRLDPSEVVYEQLYQAFYAENERLTPLLAALVFQNPSLLMNDPELVLINDDAFDHTLAVRLFSNDALMKSASLSALSWLWGYKPEIFEGPMFIPAESLRHLVPGLNNDDLRLALLLQALKAGDLSHQIITLVLSSLSDEEYRVFLSPKAHRSVPYSESLIEMAQLLEKSGFIQSLKLNEARQRIRFVPHGSSAFRRQ